MKYFPNESIYILYCKYYINGDLIGKKQKNTIRFWSNEAATNR